MTKQIKVVIEDGEFKLDFTGFQGTDCYEERKKILQELRERGIEATVIEDEPKAEAGVYVQEKETVQH